MNATFKTIMLWMSLLVVIFLAWHFAQIQKKETPLKFSDFMTQVDAGQVQDATRSGGRGSRIGVALIIAGAALLVVALIGALLVNL